MTFSIPLQAGIGFDHLFEKEIWMTVVLKKVLALKPNEAFVDVGVNLGQTLLKVKSTNLNIQYIGFEPNMTCVAYVNKLISRNGLGSVQIFPVGISDNDGHAVLYHASDKLEDSSASIIKEFRDVSNLGQKIIITFSEDRLSFLQDHVLGVVKIDVEGAELEVVGNLKSFINKDRPIIICEILPVYNIDNAFRLDRQNALIKIIKELKYLIYRIEIDGTLFEIDEIGIHSEIEDSNYLLVPLELKKFI
ncbi:MAG: FkbM family methyltransferase [Cyclobacteriaceae bacterium]